MEYGLLLLSVSPLRVHVTVVGGEWEKVQLRVKEGGREERAVSRRNLTGVSRTGPPEREQCDASHTHTPATLANVVCTVAHLSFHTCWSGIFQRRGFVALRSHLVCDMCTPPLHLRGSQLHLSRVPHVELLKVK